MFDTGLSIRHEFGNIFMDYRNETNAGDETRWIDYAILQMGYQKNIFFIVKTEFESKHRFTQCAVILTGSLPERFCL